MNLSYDEYVGEEYIDDVEYDESDMRQSSSGALVRMSKRVGGWAQNERSLNFKDINNSYSPGSWASTLLNGLAPGTSASQRVGNQIRIKLIRCRYYVDEDYDLARFVLVYDRQSNGVAPTTAEVFQNITIVSEVNWTYRDRFVFIEDTVIPFNGDDHYELCIETDLLTTYNNGSAGTVADIATGSLYIFVFGVTSAAGGFSPTAFVRIEYEE